MSRTDPELAIEATVQLLAKHCDDLKNIKKYCEDQPDLENHRYRAYAIFQRCRKNLQKVGDDVGDGIDIYRALIKHLRNQGLRIR